MKSRTVKAIPKSVLVHFKRHEADQKDLMLIHKIVRHNAKVLHD